MHFEVRCLFSVPLPPVGSPVTEHRFPFAEETGLSEAQQSAVRYMLLMSFARFQIDGAIKRDLARHFPDAKSQRAMGMWAAFKTASAVSKWQGECALKYLPAGDITGR